MKSSLWLVPIFLIFLSCEFGLEDENNVEISPVPQNDIGIELKNFPDTLTILEDIAITYNLHIEGFPAIAIFVVIGDETQYLGYDYKGSFSIYDNYPEIKTSGYLPFEFVVFSTSRTGSMADRSQRELVLFSMKRTIHIDHSPVKPINFTKTEDRDGSIYLAWDKYENKNLRSLKLKRTSIKEGSTIVDTQVIPLHKDSLQYHEQSFLGAKIEFELISENNMDEVATGSKAKFTAPPTKIKGFREVGANQLEINWNRAHFYNNSQGYALIGTNRSILYRAPNPQDTTAIISNLPFGSEIEITLQTVSKQSSDHASSKSVVWLGDKIPYAKNILYEPIHKTFFHLDAPHLVKVKDGQRDSALFNFEDFGTTSFSPDGESIFLKSADKILEISTASLSLVNTYTVGVQFLSFVVLESTIVVSREFGDSFSILSVLDKNTGSLLQVYHLTYNTGSSTEKNVRRLFRSPLPGYLYGDTGGDVAVFKLSSNGLIESGKYAKGLLTVLSENTDQIYVFNRYTRAKYYFPSLELVPGTEVNLPFDEYCLDEVNGVIGSVTGTNFNIHDLETFAIVKSIPLNVETSAMNMKLKGGFIFKPSGGYTYSMRTDL